mmetsp:Transcript_21761/g.40616  ORF Transcript_21761/g.40616 Transcript_21761/m.40616 type:complete len:112 (-) Transcript_21761:677-1012(-)
MINVRDEQYQVDASFPPDKEESWPYGPELDGWSMAHQMLRGQIADIREALQAQAKRGPIEKDWQLESLKLLVEIQMESIHEHHTTEDEAVFPFLKQRCKYPKKRRNRPRTH